MAADRWRCLHASAAFAASASAARRALRWYCRKPGPEVRALAKARNPHATGFKLSDMDLNPSYLPPRVYSGRKRRRGGGQQPAAEAAAPEPPPLPPGAMLPSGDAGRWNSAKQRAGGPGAQQPHILGPPVEVSCETDIFEAMGLHYVPPHMRDI